MAEPSDAEIESALITSMTAAFNRSINALEEAGAIDARKLRANYRAGTEYYDLITVQMQYTARYGAHAIRELFARKREK